MIGERLKRARSAAGLSMEKLGKIAGVSATMIKKYEHDESMPSSPVLIKMAQALGVRTEFFFRPTTVELSAIEYRKRFNTPQRVLKKILADALDQAERWFELRNLWPEFPIPDFERPANLPDVATLEDLETFSAAVREAWQLGLNPLPDMIDLLESKGILVIMTRTESADRVDGIQASVEKQPIIVISDHWPGCRQRFTLAHELGHLLLHDFLPDHMDEEQACDRFASAFLLPRPEAIKHLGAQRHSIDWKEIHLLKHEYGLSMGSILYRCRDLGILTPQKHKTLSIQFSAKGWRKKEPGEAYPQEQTRLFEQLVHRGAGEGLISDSKAAELLKMPVARFRTIKMMEAAAS